MNETLIAALERLQRGIMPQSTQNLLRMLHNGYAETVETYARSGNGQSVIRSYHLKLTNSGLILLEGTQE